MNFLVTNSYNIEKEIYNTITYDIFNSKYQKAAKAINDLVNKNNYTIFGSFIHKLISQSNYKIDNIDILIGPFDKKLKKPDNNILKKIFIKDANVINFSKHIICHDVLIINKIKINYIYIDIVPYSFILNEIPYYFLKNFYMGNRIYSFKPNIMIEMKLYCDYNDKIIQKYKKRGVKILSLN